MGNNSGRLLKRGEGLEVPRKMAGNKDVRKLGYEDCLDRKAASDWLERASLDELNDALASIEALGWNFGLLQLPGINYICFLFSSTNAVFSRFIDMGGFSSRLGAADQFVYGELNWIDTNALFPEFYELWGLVWDALASHDAWEKAHSWLLTGLGHPTGPGGFDALTYSGRHSKTRPDSQEIQEILLEEAKGLIIRDKTPDSDVAERAASGEMSVGEIEEICRNRRIDAYSILVPLDEEELAYEGVLGRLASTFDLSGLEFLIDVGDDFLIGPAEEMRQTEEGAFWLFWTLLGSHDLVKKASLPTLTACGRVFNRSGGTTGVPWFLEGAHESGPVDIKSTLIAAAYVFTAAILPSAGLPEDLVEKASRFLVRGQLESGGWGAYVGEESSVVATTMAAWALHRRGGHSHKVEHALQRLEGAADYRGGWSDLRPIRAGKLPSATLTSAILELHHEVRDGAGLDLENAGIGERQTLLPDKTVVVLTALEVEYKAVLSRLGQCQEMRTEYGTRFEVGRFTGTRINWRVAVAEIGEGNTRAAIETVKATEKFNPDLFLFVGVAGCLDKDLRHGDIVVASKVHRYHAGRAEEEGFRARPNTFPSPHRLEQSIKSARRDENRFVGGVSEGQSYQPPSVVVKPIASGDVLVASPDSSTCHHIKSSYNDTVAVDMESAGMYEAASYYEGVPALTIRGISDFLSDKDTEASEIDTEQSSEADDEQDTETSKTDAKRQELASDRAAAFAFFTLGAMYPEDVNVRTYAGDLEYNEAPLAVDPYRDV